MTGARLAEWQKEQQDTASHGLAPEPPGAAIPPAGPCPGDHDDEGLTDAGALSPVCRSPDAGNRGLVFNSALRSQEYFDDAQMKEDYWKRLESMGDRAAVQLLQLVAINKGTKPEEGAGDDAWSIYHFTEAARKHAMAKNPRSADEARKHYHLAIKLRRQAIDTDEHQLRTPEGRARIAAHNLARFGGPALWPRVVHPGSLGTYICGLDILDAQWPPPHGSSSAAGEELVRLVDEANGCVHLGDEYRRGLELGEGETRGEPTQLTPGLAALAASVQHPLPNLLELRFSKYPSATAKELRTATRGVSLRLMERAVRALRGGDPRSAHTAAAGLVDYANREKLNVGEKLTTLQFLIQWLRALRSVHPHWVGPWHWHVDTEREPPVGLDIQELVRTHMMLIDVRGIEVAVRRMSDLLSGKRGEFFEGFVIPMLCAAEELPGSGKVDCAERVQQNRTTGPEDGSSDGSSGISKSHAVIRMRCHNARILLGIPGQVPAVHDAAVQHQLAGLTSHSYQGSQNGGAAAPAASAAESADPDIAPAPSHQSVHQVDDDPSIHAATSVTDAGLGQPDMSDTSSYK